MAYYSFSKVMNPNPFVFPSYYFGSFTFDIVPYFSNAFLN